MKTDKPILKISFARERLTAIFRSPFVVPVFFSSNSRKAPRLFSPDMETMLLEQYEDVWVKASGSTLRAAEKYALIATQINDVGKKKGWQAVTGPNVEMKVDILRCNGRSVYKSFRRRTRTGAPVPEDFDLDVRLCCDRK